MKKQCTAMLAAAVMLLQCMPMSTFAGLIELRPGNMVFLDVQYPDGTSAAGVTVTLHNAAGTEVGGIINDESFFTSNASGIDGTELGDDRYNYYVPWSTFTPYVAPETLLSVGLARTDWDVEFYETHTSGPIYINGGLGYKLQLYSCDAAQPTALTVPANQFAAYVDAKWSNRTAGAYFTSPNFTRYINFAPDAGLLADAFTLQNGATALFDAFDTNYQAELGLNFSDGSGGAVTAYRVTVSDTATEYVLCRMPLHQLCPYFEMDGNYLKDGLTYDLRQDTEHTSAILSIQSGAVINVVIPDSSGYVEFYLEKSTRSYTLNYYCHYAKIPNEYGVLASGSHNFSSSGTAATLTEHFVEALQPPLDEVVLTQVPAGTYTLTYENLPDGYAAPKTTTLTVTNSQEVQYLQLMLERDYSLGDVNLDGNVNAMDASVLLIAAAKRGAGLETGLTDVQVQAAELNADGVYNAKDAALILQFAAYAAAGGTLEIEEFLAQ